MKKFKVLSPLGILINLANRLEYEGFSIEEYSSINNHLVIIFRMRYEGNFNSVRRHISTGIKSGPIGFSFNPIDIQSVHGGPILDIDDGEEETVLYSSTTSELRSPGGEAGNEGSNGRNVTEGRKVCAILGKGIEHVDAIGGNIGSNLTGAIIDVSKNNNNFVDSFQINNRWFACDGGLSAIGSQV